MHLHCSMRVIVQCTEESTPKQINGNKVKTINVRHKARKVERKSKYIVDDHGTVDDINSLLTACWPNNRRQNLH